MEGAAVCQGKVHVGRKGMVWIAAVLFVLFLAAVCVIVKMARTEAKEMEDDLRKADELTGEQVD